MLRYNNDETYSENDLGTDNLIFKKMIKYFNFNVKAKNDGMLNQYGGRGDNKWFFEKTENNDELIADEKLNKTYDPKHTFNNIKNYSIGIDNVLKRKHKYGSKMIKSIVRQQPFTWEGPRKSSQRSYAGNSLVAGPFWPVDLYEVIDHHFYKTFFEYKNGDDKTTNIKVKTPIYCDYNICRPVIKKMKGIQVVSNHSASNRCLNERNTTKELASMWYDTSDHYQIIATY